ncbi:MAG: TipAS antibiotic-recognition domain-containing protein, partial [Gemmatimonadota bacterium]
MPAWFSAFPFMGLLPPAFALLQGHGRCQERAESINDCCTDTYRISPPPGMPPKRRNRAVPRGAGERFHAVVPLDPHAAALADMYEADARFGAFFEGYAEGLTAFVTAAIRANAHYTSPLTLVTA